MLAYLAADLPAVFFRHHDVKQNDIGLIHFENRHALNAVVCGLDLIAFLFKVHFKQVADICIIINNKYFSHRYSILRVAY